MYLLACKENEDDKEDQEEETEEEDSAENFGRAHYLWTDRRMTQKRNIRLRRTELLAGNCDLPPLYRVIQYFCSIFPDNPRDGVIAGTQGRTGGHLDTIDLSSHQRPQAMNMEHVKEGYGPGGFRRARGSCERWTPVREPL